MFFADSNHCQLHFSVHAAADAMNTKKAAGARPQALHESSLGVTLDVVTLGYNFYIL